MATNRATRGTLVTGALRATGTITAQEITNCSCTFVVGTEASNIINVAMTFKDGNGTTLAVPKMMMWYLATDATGLTPATSAPSGGIAAGTNGKLVESINNLSGFLVTTAAGLNDVNITDTGTPTFYMVVVMPSGGLMISGAITFA